jgi:hypothetical protein
LTDIRDFDLTDGFLGTGDPVNVYPFIEAEQAGQHSVKRACELLEVSRSAVRWLRFRPAACGAGSQEGNA